MQNSEIKKIAIFGGSFDPPHYGHYDIVKNLERSFDKVIVVPAYISPFKSGGSDAAARFAICKKLFTSEKTEVCRREISKKGVSYSVDTAAYFAKKYGGCKLYWVIGSEELLRLDEWHDVDRLKTLVNFLVVPRPGYEASPEIVKSLKSKKIKFTFAKFDGLEISSTRLKIDIAFGKANTCMPSVAANAVKKSGLFDVYGKYVSLLYKYGLGERRIEHTYAVACRGAELAKLYGANTFDAVVACILHDVAKSVDPKDYAKLVDYKDFPLPTVHGLIGAYIAKRDLGVSDEIAHAIYYHSTATENMSVLDEIVYLADKTAAGRHYEGLEYIRYLCSVDKDLAMYRALNEISTLRDSRPCEHSVKALDAYAARVAGKAFPEMPSAPQPKIETGSKALLVTDKKSSAVATVKKSSDKLPKAVHKSSKEVSAHFTADKDEDVGIRGIAMTVAKELDLHKGKDIDVIDLAGKTIIADYFVIASASSTTAVKALCGYVEDKLTKKYGIDPLKRDIDSEWAALDYGGVIVHIFTEKTREFYNIERLWSDGTNVTRIGD